MYTLHYAPDNASLIIRIVLEQAGIPYQTVLVNRAIREQDGAAYRALNPAGLIPMLVTTHGAISETGAILLWLGDQHGLAPAPDHPARQPFLKWLFYIANTAHPDMRQLFYPHRYVAEDGRASHFTMTCARINANFALLDAAAQNHPALFTPDGLLLPYTAALQRWAHLYPAIGPRWFRLSDTPTRAGCRPCRGPWCHTVYRPCPARPARRQRLLTLAVDKMSVCDRFAANQRSYCCHLERPAHVYASRRS
jgi:glutathione S-transferase